MEINVGSLYSANQAQPVIDSQAAARVREQILNSNNQKTIDVSKLNLSKFNRVSLGTDLYSARTNNETALKASKAATDFGVNLSETFNSNVQYLNSQAAQSLFSSKENGEKTVINLENTTKATEDRVVLAFAQTAEAQEMNKDKRGSNPFSFYMPAENSGNETEEVDSIFGSINIFA